MNYLTAENISKSYGERTLFQELSFGINKDQKIAFVAKNGSGKTSILNIVAGVDTPDDGQVVKRKSIPISYLSQRDNLNPELTIEESIFDTKNKVLSIIHDYENALNNPDDTDAYQKAFELLGLGARFSAEDALSSNLINAIVDDPLAAATQTAKALAKKPPEALTISRDLLRGDRSDLYQRMDEEARYFSQRLQSGEA